MRVCRSHTRASTLSLLLMSGGLAGDLAARAERLLRFAIERGLDAPGVPKRQDKLILSLPTGFFSWPEQGLLGAPAIDLHDNPAQLCRFKIKSEQPIRRSRSFE